MKPERFDCEVKGCGKSFSRFEHLSRHHVNHAPSVLFSCEVADCDKAFVRKDVKEKHEERHKLRIETSKRKKLNLMSNIVTKGSIPAPVTTSDQGHSSGNGRTIVGKVIESRDATSVLNASLSNTYHSPFFPNILNYTETPVTNQLAPYDLTQWLFNDEEFLSRSNKSSPTNSYSHEFGIQADRLLEDAFCIPKSFSPANHATVNDEMVSKLITFVPELSNKPFGAIQIERCLEIFWSVCQVQFPILHKPSFSTTNSHPFLILGMIMIGAGLVRCTDMDESQIFQSYEIAHDIADTIAVPLRWLILSSDDFCSPPKAWIVQSLIILEIYEILFSTRKLHQRAYLHHGLKIQLLRRSRLLGGDPLNRSNDYKELTEGGSDLWENWIELESLKRAALVSFYLDTIHATIYGHEIILFAHQIKLLMPCDDMVWEMSNVDINNFPPQIETPSFITALTKLLHQENLDVSPLGKKILLAGLLTIKVQMEQKDLEITFLDWKPVKESWKDTIYKAIEVWRDDICHEDCCDTRNCFYLSSSWNSELLPSTFSVMNTQCKFPIYHLTQTFMTIKQYDCIIYVGASKRMDVKTTDKDYRTVDRRIKAWSTSYNGRISVLHCYIFLYEMLFKGDKKMVYDPSRDPLFHRPNIVALSLFVIWAYNFSLSGPESYIYGKSVEGINSYKEEGYDYLKRIIDSLQAGSNRNYVSNKSLNYYAECLPKTKDKHNMVGLLLLFMDKFKESQSEICKEYGGLIENCIERSTGKEYTVAN